MPIVLLMAALLALVLAASACDTGMVGGRTTVTRADTAGTIPTDALADAPTTSPATAGSTAGGATSVPTQPMTSTAIPLSTTTAFEPPLFPDAWREEPVFLKPFGQNRFLAYTGHVPTVYCLDGQARVQWSIDPEHLESFQIYPAVTAPRALLFVMEFDEGAGTGAFRYSLNMLEEVDGSPSVRSICEFDGRPPRNIVEPQLSDDGTRVALLWSLDRAPNSAQGDVDQAAIEVMDDSGYTLWKQDLPENERVYGWSVDSRLDVVAISYRPFTGREVGRVPGTVEVYDEGSLVQTIDLPGPAWVDLSPDGTDLIVTMLAGDIPGENDRVELYQVGSADPLWSIPVPAVEDTRFVADGELVLIREAVESLPAGIGQATSGTTAPPGFTHTFRIVSSACGIDLWHPLESSGVIAGPIWNGHARKLVYREDGTDMHLTLLDLTPSGPVTIDLPSGAGLPYFSHDGTAALTIQNGRRVSAWGR